MSLRQLKLLTIALPTLLIGGFEYARHDLFIHYLSMQTGNLFITLLTLLLSYLFATWVFRRFGQINGTLAEEKAARAVYEERERLARELHDTIAQTLFFLNVKLKQGKLEDARSAVADIDNHVRQAIFNLRTAPAETVGVEARLGKWLHDWSELSGIALDASLEMPEGALTRAEELQLFAIIQEACTNIRKHSKAERASIALRASRKKWSLEIADNGIGIAESSSSANRYGIPLMRKRAEELGATFELSPAVKLAAGSGSVSGSGPRAARGTGVRIMIHSKGGSRT